MSKVISKRSQRQLDRQRKAAQQRQQKQNQRPSNKRPPIDSIDQLIAEMVRSSSPFEQLDPNLTDQLSLTQVEFDRQICIFLRQHADRMFQAFELGEPKSDRHRVQQMKLGCVRSLACNQLFLELAAFAMTQKYDAVQLQPSPMTLETEDERCTFWEMGWWTASIVDPNCQQTWKGNWECGEYITLDIAIDHACRQGFVDHADRASVKAVCLEMGIYGPSDCEQAGWLIEKTDFPEVISNPNASLWVLIEQSSDHFSPTGYNDEDDSFNAAILEPFRVNWLQSKGQVVARHKTLAEIFAIAFPSLTWSDLEYQARWIERVAEDGNSYSFFTGDGRRLQISREKSPEEGCDYPLELV